MRLAALLLLATLSACAAPVPTSAPATNAGARAAGHPVAFATAPD